MMKTISVITAVHDEALQFLPDAYQSLRRQKLPDGWGWQWIVQGDGLDLNQISIFDDDRVRIGVNPKGGPGVTRTTALGIASGSLVKVLDADDQLTGGALERDISALQEHQVAWTVSSALDLDTNGGTTAWDHADPEAGVIEIGSVLSYWANHDGRLPVMPATLCMQTDLLLALGGWMALASSEDTGLLLAANQVSTGYFIDHVSILYRKHPEQTTMQDYHQDDAIRNLRHQLIKSRADVISRTNWRWVI